MRSAAQIEAAVKLNTTCSTKKSNSGVLITKIYLIVRSIFFSQLYVILSFDFLCFFLSWLKVDRVAQQHLHLREKHSLIHSCILIQVFSPPPSPRAKTSSRSSDNVEEDQTDCEASAAVESKWNFLCWWRQCSDAVFLIQLSFVCMLVALSILQLCLRSPNCEEKTAYFKIISSCLS